MKKVTDEYLEEMLEEYSGYCLYNRDKKGRLTRISNSWTGMLYVKENGKWKSIELYKKRKSAE
jgi:hypothetical protein